MDEERINEMEEVEVMNNEVSTVSDGEKTGKIVVGIGALICAGIGAAIYANRKRFEKRTISKLEKKGYVVTKPEIVVEATSVEETD